MFRGNVGRLLIVAAGAGCLAALIFVVLPMLNAPAPPVAPEEVVTGMPGVGETAGDESEIGVAVADVAAGGRQKRRPGSAGGVSGFRGGGCVEGKSGGSRRPAAGIGCRRRGSG